MANVAEFAMKIRKHGFSVLGFVGVVAFLLYRAAEVVFACPRLESELMIYFFVLVFCYGQSSACQLAKGPTERTSSLDAASVLKRFAKGALLAYLDEESITKALAFLRRSGQIDIAPSVLTEAHRRGIYLEAPAYSIVMGAFNKRGKPRQTMEVFQSMQEEESVTLDAVSYSDAICACGLLKDIRRVNRLFAQMQSAGIKPSAHSYAVLIEAHRRCGLPKRCWEIYRSLHERGIVCDGRLFKVTIESVGECCLREHGLEILQAMQASGLHPAHSLQNLVICAWKSKLPRHLVEGFHALNDNGMSLSATAYRCLMAAHEKSDPGRTVQLHRQAAERASS